MNKLLPVFMKLQDTKCLVVGGGNIALQKINQLLDSDAKVTIIAPDIIESINILPVKLIYREFQAQDIEGFKIVIAATNNRDVNKFIYKKCTSIGIPVNIVDQPDLCSFYMGSVYQDRDLKIAISTNGNCPSFATYLKDYIKNISKGKWGRALDDLIMKRKKIINKPSSYDYKKSKMNQIVKDKMNPDLVDEKNIGKVYLVGAGPGNPDLITIKGIKAIQNADIIIHDALIHPYLVFEVNPIAKKIYVGKRQDNHALDQGAINTMMIKEALNGNKIVRLKGGDPFIFGRGGEEVIALADKGVLFEVIPGVTSGIAAASEFGIPLTHRDKASSALFITGHQSGIMKLEEWSAIAKLNSTIIFYMGIKKIDKIVHSLIDHGKCKDTPIAIIENASLNNQKIIISNLKSIIDKVENCTVNTPAIIIVGAVVHNYRIIQDYIDSVSSTDIINNIDFNFWKDKSTVF